jgi:hypothetical protein
MRATRLLPVLLVIAMLVAACGDSTADNAQATADSLQKQLKDVEKSTKSTLPASLGGGSQKCPAKKPAVGRMRVVNLATKDGSAGPSVDVYAAGYGPDQKCRPLVTAVEYGTVSDYFDVPATPYSSPAEGSLTYYDAGTTKQDSGFWGGNTPPDGVQSTKDQETVILTSGSDQGSDDPTYTNVTEKSGKQPDQDVKVTAGKSLLLVSPSGANSAIGHGGDGSNFVFTIDGKCIQEDAIPGDSMAGTYGVGIVNGNGAPFTVDPGPHTVGIIVNEPGVGIAGEDCDGKTPVVTEDIEVDEGKALGVYLGGTSKDDLKIYEAAIDV